MAPLAWSVPVLIVLAGGPPAPANELARCPLQRPHYATRPHLRPAAMCLTRRPARPTSGVRILVTPRASRGGRQALVVLSSAGRILWYGPRRRPVRDLKTVTYRGRSLLAYYQDAPGARAHDVLLDDHYRVVARIRPGGRYRLDMHDVQVTPRGTAYVAAYHPVRQRGRGPVITDYVLREVDIATGRVLFEWHALRHVPVAATYKPRPARGRPWDYFHGNSIDAPPGTTGTIIVSARNTSAIYGIDRATGALRWTLGGRFDDFGIAARHPGWRFCAQHDARRLPGGELSVFDNGGRHLSRACAVHPARVEVFRLDAAARTVTLARSVSSTAASEDGRGYRPAGTGGARRQPDGGLLVDWGSAARVTEIARDGEVVFGLRFAHPSYRAVASPWVGRPRGRPAVVARRRGRRALDVYASWNGATQIAAWQVLAGRTRIALAPAGASFAFAGLETRMRLATRARWVAVRPLRPDGVALRRSRAVRVR